MSQLLVSQAHWPAHSTHSPPPSPAAASPVPRGRRTLPHARLLPQQRQQHATRAAAIAPGGSDAAADPSSSSSSRQPVVSVDGLVDRLVVAPAWRSSPWEAEAARAAANCKRAVITFVSESGICRAQLAAAAFSQLLAGSPLADLIAVQARATRDYCIGQPPHPAALAAAAALGIALQPAPDAGSSASTDAAAASGLSRAVLFDPSRDIVTSDLVLVVDKFTAADVLREVSSYDLVNPGGRYSCRVRLLGAYHPRLADAAAGSPDGADLDDALYGNEGGDEERAAVLATAKLVVEACRNLLEQMSDLATAAGVLPAGGAAAAARANGSSSSNGDGSSSSTSSSGTGSSADDGSVSRAARFRAALVKHVQAEGVIDWLVPPMLQGSTGADDLGGWV